LGNKSKKEKGKRKKGKGKRKKEKKWIRRDGGKGSICPERGLISITVGEARGKRMRLGLNGLKGLNISTLAHHHIIKSAHHFPRCDAKCPKGKRER
jgi:hypothetical protein